MSYFSLFQSTHPARGATNVIIEQEQGLLTFQSTHPARGATGAVTHRMGVAEISIHAPREGCDRLLWMLLLPTQISIHAPREGCDGQPGLAFLGGHGISIHAPREGCDLRRATLRGREVALQSTPPGVRLAAPSSSSISTDTFQPTPPAWGATRCAPSCAALWTNFNPRTPRGVRLSQAVTFTGGNLISIHAPREG